MLCFHKLLLSFFLPRTEEFPIDVYRVRIVLFIHLFSYFVHGQFFNLHLSIQHLTAIGVRFLHIILPLLGIGKHRSHRHGHIDLILPELFLHRHLLLQFCLATYQLPPNLHFLAI